MRVGVLLGVLSLLAAPVMAAPVDYHMVVDEAESSLGLNLGLWGLGAYAGVGAEGIDEVSMAGTMHLQVDEDANTAMIGDFEATVTEGLVLVIDLRPWALPMFTLDTGPGDPLMLSGTGSGGHVPYDEAGNIEFDVDGIVTGDIFVTATEALNPLAEAVEQIVGIALGIGMDGIPDEGATMTLGPDSLLKITIGSLVGVLDPDGSVGLGPVLDIPLLDDGFIILPITKPPIEDPNDPRAFMMATYGMAGNIQAIAEPVSVSLLALGGIGLLLRRRR